MTRGADDPDEGADEAPRAERRRRRRRARADAPKEKVLHTRVPAVLDEELKRLAENLRVPVSNVVRAILEDALDAVDSVSERAEDELLGFADRLSRRRDELRHRVEREGEGREGRDDGPEPPAPRGADASESVEAPPCPAAAGDALDGVIGFQPLVLATDTACTVCGRELPAGADAHRALFDEPGRRMFLGPDCRLLPAGRRTS